MSKHSSLKATGTVGGKRSVLKRFERVKLLKERGEWKKGQSPPNTGSLSDVYEPRGFFLPAKESLLFLRM